VPGSVVDVVDDVVVGGSDVVVDDRGDEVVPWTARASGRLEGRVRYGIPVTSAITRIVHTSAPATTPRRRPAMRGGGVCRAMAGRSSIGGTSLPQRGFDPEATRYRGS
jgi:hypothetical protein